jgi:hypothetical protein
MSEFGFCDLICPMLTRRSFLGTTTAAAVDESALTADALSLQSRMSPCVVRDPDAHRVPLMGRGASGAAGTSLRKDEAGAPTARSRVTFGTNPVPRTRTSIAGNVTGAASAPLEEA